MQHKAKSNQRIGAALFQTKRQRKTGRDEFAVSIGERG